MGFFSLWSKFGNCIITEAPVVLSAYLQFDQFSWNFCNYYHITAKGLAASTPSDENSRKVFDLCLRYWACWFADGIRFLHELCPLHGSLMKRDLSHTGTTHCVAAWWMDGLLKAQINDGNCAESERCTLRSVRVWVRESYILESRKRKLREMRRFHVQIKCCKCVPGCSPLCVASPISRCVFSAEWWELYGSERGE